MLITENFLNLDDYSFQNSPSSSSDGISTNNDFLDSPSDEDFLQQLSSDLDIPLLLNPGEDELNVLNSFLDKSPEEILSEVKSPPCSTSLLESQLNETENTTQWNWDELFDLPDEIETLYRNNKDEHICKNDEVKGSDGYLTRKLNKAIVKPSNSLKNEQILETPPTSPECQQVFLVQNSEKGSPCNIKKAVKLENKAPLTQTNVSLQNARKVSCKRHATFPQMIKSASPNSKVLIIPSTTSGAGNFCSVPTYHPIQPDIPQKVIVIDNRHAIPLETTSIPKTSISNINNFSSCISIPSLQTSMPLIIKTETETSSSIPIKLSPSIDPKALKRQQRMIKNRESACLSRKKKKDYLTSLERKVQILTTENERLKAENAKLKDQLSKFIPNGAQTKTLTKVISLCAVLCLMFFNVDYIRLPHLTRKINLNTQDELAVLPPHVGRNLLWSSIGIEDTNVTDNNATDASHLMCPVYINQTENVRLALELQRWIGKPINSNNSTNNFMANHKEDKPSRKNKRLKNKINSVKDNYAEPVYEMKKRSNSLRNSIPNEIQVFAPNLDQIYSEFFEAINRQDDTFYLVSFSPDHMLLPALNYNKTRRPKMSLILPSLLNDDSSQLSVIPLMQIDCEVLDTQIIHVKNGTIPRHLRSYNSTTSPVSPPHSSNVGSTSNSTATSENFHFEKNYKPYFMRKSYLRSIKNEAERRKYGS
ncbi:cyclic AMP-dependent transcription factor ATF-6 alpha [Agrilus planipennis]|uniref:Cyclic AMP-dependent transcription factor ATF-6 alpha n=1 Tax=Agrilus planipennis TaxID=224129 RepID=A0A1W4XGD3_AGRPL|nr:cyclic AMP-dependent transcription factor ATF-6 alpha [Agrilus planipennis]